MPSWSTYMSVEQKLGEPQSVIIAAGATCDSTYHGDQLWGITFPDVVAKLMPSSLIASVRSRVEKKAHDVHKKTGCTNVIQIQFESREHDEERAQRIVPKELL